MTLVFPLEAPLSCGNFVMEWCDRDLWRIFRNMSQIGSNIKLKFESESVFAYKAMNKAGSEVQIMSS